jgi:hypothetical protein
MNEFDSWNFNRKYGNNMADEKEMAKLLKESLKIVDELANYDFEDMDEGDKEDLEKLIEKAKELKKNKLWKL